MIYQFFEFPFLLPLVVILPVFGYWALRKERINRVDRLTRFGSKNAVLSLAPVTSRRGVWRKLAMIMALFLLGIAMSGPRWGLSASEVTSEGVDVVIALDASLSMLAQDDRPSRMKSMVQVAKQLNSLSPEDRFALLAFAGKSYILTPLTTDPGALRLYLDNLDPAVVGQAGSSLASTVRQGINLLNSGRAENDRAIILMTDGEGFDEIEDVLSEARKAANLGIEVITVGFGTTQGNTIPIEENGVVTQMLDMNGQVVVTKYRPDDLRAIADAADGVFIPAEVSDKAVQIRNVLNQLKTGARKIATGRSLQPQFQWFVFGALILLLFDILASLRPRSRKTNPKNSVTTVTGITLLIVTLNGCSLLESFQDRRAYNEGTALLGKDSIANAIEVLDKLVNSSDSEVKFRSLFNSGYGYLVRDSLDSALVRYRAALILRPDDKDAKWNYELALRPPQGGGGGGGGGNSEKSSGGDEGPQDNGANDPTPQPSGGISQQRAGLILDNIEREERYVQSKRQQKNVPQPPPRGNDW